MQFNVKNRSKKISFIGIIYFKNKENFAMKFPADWEEWTLFSSLKK